MMLVAAEQQVIIDLTDEHSSVLFATRLARCLTAPLIVAFHGDIGAGKTTIIRAMLRALGVDSAIKSPTFSLVESYSCDDFMVHHFDLYRIHQEEELEYIGFREYLSQHSVCCIEWAERAGFLLPIIDVHCSLTIKDRGRELILSAASLSGQQMLLTYGAGEQ